MYLERGNLDSVVPRTQDSIKLFQVQNLLVPRTLDTGWYLSTKVAFIERHNGNVVRQIEIIKEI